MYIIQYYSTLVVGCSALWSDIGECCQKQANWNAESFKLQAFQTPSWWSSHLQLFNLVLRLLALRLHKAFFHGSLLHLLIISLDSARLCSLILLFFTRSMRKSNLIFVFTEYIKPNLNSLILFIFSIYLFIIVLDYSF